MFNLHLNVALEAQKIEANEALIGVVCVHPVASGRDMKVSPERSCKFGLKSSSLRANL